MSWCKEHQCPDFVCEPFPHHTDDGKESLAAFRKRYENQPPAVQAFVRRLGEEARKDDADDAAFGRLVRRSAWWASVAWVLATLGIIYLVRGY